MDDDLSGNPGARTAVETATVAAVERFNAALNEHDVDAVMAAMTGDCVFENTWPPPDGVRFVGQEAVRTFWANMLHDSPDARFETEELVVAGDRCVVRWRYTYTGDDGSAHHLRGIDLFRVQGGLIAEKLAYVKG